MYEAELKLKLKTERRANLMTTEIITRNRAQAGCTVASQRLQPSSLVALAPRATAVRSYLRSLRAAEMAAWEMTGGDYVLARFATPATQIFAQAA